jgi:hypothetical protein
MTQSNFTLSLSPLLKADEKCEMLWASAPIFIARIKLISAQSECVIDRSGAMAGQKGLSLHYHV